MYYKIYKALDNAPSFLGLQGSYQHYAAIGVAIALVLGFSIGGATNGLIGVVVFLVGTAAAYLAVMAFQARFTERERKKFISSRKSPDVIVFAPESFTSLARKQYEIAQKRAKKPSSGAQ